MLIDKVRPLVAKCEVFIMFGEFLSHTKDSMRSPTCSRSGTAFTNLKLSRGL